MCTYQIINILTRNATTRNLVGKLTVWLNILSQRCFRVGPSVKTVNIHVYTYIFLNKLGDDPCKHGYILLQMS